MKSESIKSLPDQPELGLETDTKETKKIRKGEVELAKLMLLKEKLEKPETEKETESRMLYPWGKSRR